MIKSVFCLSIMAVATLAGAEAPVTAPTNAPVAIPHTISIQEMLVIGHSGMKLHSLAMITQGKVKGGIDESFLPGFKVCAKDPAVPVRSVVAQVMGKHFIEGTEHPNPEAVKLLVKLAKDSSPDVCFSAVYHGLCKLNPKSPEIVALLLDVAASNREFTLYNQIAKSLADNRDQAIQYLDQKLKTDNAITYFEIYKDMTGKPPPHRKKFLDRPSSRPKIFIFKGGDDAEAYKAELIVELKTLGIETPDLFISGVGANHVLLLKTYLTKDRLIVEKAFAKPGKFTLTQNLWLTPALEVQLDAARKARTE